MSGKGIAIRIPVEPEPKLRPRFHIRRGRISTETPYKTKVFENTIAEYYMYEAKGFKYEEKVPLVVDLVFGMKIPSSYSKKKRQDIDLGLLMPTTKPDIDNLTKSILDALNGIAFVDDSQIVQITAAKEYASEPYIYLNIREM